MEKKTAWIALFSKVIQKGVDLDAAVQALKEVDQIDPADAAGLSKDVIDWAEEFLLDSTAFIAQNAGDSRVGKWQQLAGAASPAASTVTPIRSVAVSPSSVTGVSSSSPSPLVTQASASTSALKLSALRGAKVQASTPTLVSLSVSRTDDDRPRRDNKKTRKEAGQASVGDETPSTPDAASAPAVVDPPQSVHGFAQIQDTTRATAEILREEAAVRGKETPAKRKKRLADEAEERQRRFDQDAAECGRRQIQQEEAFKRRLAIQGEADERKRLADLRLGDEQRRHDEEAEERKLKRKQEADERKRLADETARLALKDSEVPQAAVPSVGFIARPDLTARVVPPQGLTVTRSTRYQGMRARIVALVESMRSGVDENLWALKVEVLLMARSEDPQMEREGIHLEGLIRALQQDDDLRRPGYFRAVFETGGSYDD